MTRRTVRVDPQFLTELGAQLGESRGPNGEPSASDFLLIELPTIAEAFAERFDELLSLYRERDDYPVPGRRWPLRVPVRWAVGVGRYTMSN